MTLNFIKENFHINGTEGVKTPFTFFERGFRLGSGGSPTPTWQDIIISGNTALTLVNAKADGLNYLKLFGGCEQGSLPKGYTAIEYIQSSGTQYINTGIQGEAKVVIDCQGAASSSTSEIIIGTYTYPPSFFGQAGATGKYGFNANALTDVDYTTRKTFTINFNDDATVQYDSTTIQYTDSGTLYTSANYALFRAMARSSTNYYYAKARIYSVTFEQNGVYVAKMYPAKRDSDNVLGMYDTVRNTFYTNSGTGSFTAGGEVTPSPDNPIDIVCNNGILKINTEFLTADNIRDGYGINSSTGGATANSNRCYIYPFTVKAGDVVELSTTASSLIGGNLFLYSSATVNQTNFLEAVSASTETQVNGRYVRTATVTRDGYASWQGLANEATLLSAGWALNVNKTYGSIYTDGTTETVKIKGKNLWDTNNFTYAGVDYVITKTTYGFTATARSGTGTSSRVVVYIPVEYLKENTTYFVSGVTGVGNVYVGRTVNGVGDNGYYKDTGSSKKFTITDIAEGQTRFILTMYLGKTTEGTVKDFSQIQLEEGTSATDYVIPFNGGTATAEMLLAVSDNVRDVQEVLTGEIARNVGVKVFDGTEDWTYQSANSRFFCDVGLKIVGNRTCPLYCTHYQAITDGRALANVPNYSVYGATANNSVYLHDSRFTSANALKNYLQEQYNAGTPVILIFPLATPTTETVTGQTLTTQQGTNIIEITQASIDGLPLEVSYKAGVTVTVEEVENANLDDSVTVTIGE